MGKRLFQEVYASQDRTDALALPELIVVSEKDDRDTVDFTYHTVHTSYFSKEKLICPYTDYIEKHPGWELAGIYADDGISGTNTKKRDEFNRLIDDCMAGRVDMVVTKSISRFARNTLDCLKYIRQLKDKNIVVFFEKEAINTLDAKGEAKLLYLIQTHNGVSSQKVA